MQSQRWPAAGRQALQLVCPSCYLQLRLPWHPAHSSRAVMASPPGNMVQELQPGIYSLDLSSRPLTPVRHAWTGPLLGRLAAYVRPPDLIDPACATASWPSFQSSVQQVAPTCACPAGCLQSKSCPSLKCRPALSASTVRHPVSISRLSRPMCRWAQPCKPRCMPAAQGC